MQTYKTKIVEIKPLTVHTWEVTVKLIEPTDIKFQAGQYMQFKIGGMVRAYSILDIPDDNTTLTFCVGLFEHGVGSDFFRNAKPGDEVEMEGPMGNFTVEDFSKNYFFVGTGVGVAPFASLVPDMLGRGFKNHLRLLFGVRHEEDIFYFDRFRHLHNLYPNFGFTPMLSRPKYLWPGETGRVTTYLEVAYESFKNFVFYVSGSEQMVKDTRDILLKKGHSADDIKLEIFI